MLPEVKHDIARLIRRTGRTHAALARELGLSERTIGRYVATGRCPRAVAFYLRGKARR